MLADDVLDGRPRLDRRDVLALDQPRHLPPVAAVILGARPVRPVTGTTGCGGQSARDVGERGHLVDDDAQPLAVVGGRVVVERGRPASRRSSGAAAYASTRARTTSRCSASSPRRSSVVMTKWFGDRLEHGALGARVVGHDEVGLVAAQRRRVRAARAWRARRRGTKRPMSRLVMSLRRGEVAPRCRRMPCGTASGGEQAFQRRAQRVGAEVGRVGATARRRRPRPCSVEWSSRGSIQPEAIASSTSWTE